MAKATFRFSCCPFPCHGSYVSTVIPWWWEAHEVGCKNLQKTLCTGIVLLTCPHHDLKQMNHPHICFRSDPRELVRMFQVHTSIHGSNRLVSSLLCLYHTSFTKRMGSKAKMWVVNEYVKCSVFQEVLCIILPPLIKELLPCVAGHHSMLHFHLMNLK